MTTGRGVPGQVYVVGSTGSDIVKIGYSKAPAKRLWFLQVGSPVELSLLTVFEGGQNLETALHHHFRSCQVRGEWFDLGDNPVEAARAAVLVGVPGLLSGAVARPEHRVHRSRTALDSPELRFQGRDWDVRFPALPRHRAVSLLAAHGVPTVPHHAVTHPPEGCPDRRAGRPASLSSPEFVLRETGWEAQSFDDRFPEILSSGGS
ncbi:GIY-YIG nuclease family protein [Streptomyces tendae]|uniref:GIY-YIG nuclease family protein n=1 Tax=Streptomyces tendae TaxID=1932 RepID=UPI00371E16B2